MKKILWALMDDRRGSVGQAQGIINALNTDIITPIEKNISYTKSAALPNLLRGKSLLGLTAESKKIITPPFPDYVISISRRTVPVARYIKKLSPQTKLIQLMHPGNTGINDFSLIVVPEHDKNKKTTPNIHYIVGCPHRVTPAFLEEARKEWEPKFAHLPRPLTTVIIGGSIKGKPFSNENAEALGIAIKKFKEKTGGSILITTSRRTGKEPEKIIMDAIKGIPQYTFLWGDTNKNPYSGFLACADNIIATGDSVSMCCEATGTGKPIYLFIGQNWLPPKHLRFVQSLCDTKCATLLDDKDPVLFKPQKSLNAAKEIAEQIEKL